MWNPKSVEKEGSSGLVAVAIDKDRGSQIALKWATESLLSRGQTVVLFHVKLKTLVSSSPFVSNPRMHHISTENHKDLFLPFRCFCTRKNIECQDVVVEDTDVVKAILDYVSQTSVEHLVIGAPSKNGFLKRFKTTDISGNVTKGAPDFCTVYSVSKGKASIVHKASRSAPILHNQSPNTPIKPDSPKTYLHSSVSTRGLERPPIEPARVLNYQDMDSIKSPFTRSGVNRKSYGELSVLDSDLSFVSSGRPSTDRSYPLFYEDPTRTPPRLSSSSDIDNRSVDSFQFGRKSVEYERSSVTSHDSERHSLSSQAYEDVDAEMRRLKLELKQTMDMYSTACKEALTAKQKTVELQRWKIDEERRLEESRLAEEAALAIAQREKERSRAALEYAEVSKRMAEFESQKRIKAELKMAKEAEENKKAFFSHNDVRYRKYTIQEIETATEMFSEKRKIGEGGYGPVYKCYLDHTPVAIKILRPDAAQGRSQFNQEVEVLSCIRHPNMVLLLGACPDYGCLVYEYMVNGSLEDCLFRNPDSPPLSWQLRFRIAAEIGTGLHFLHQSKPEPLVHRDLKPGNILLDRNFVSKISDVGLARLVPPSVADTVTQYRMTSTAGTFCYIDPEYQQTGMLGTKSDVYSLGIMLLQLITSRPPMGLTHQVERAIEKGTFEEMLDANVTDWPFEETLDFAKMALKCAELRRKDRPDLGKVVLPELNRLRELAEEKMYPEMMGCPEMGGNNCQLFSPTQQDVMSGQMLSGYASSKSRSTITDNI